MVFNVRCWRSLLRMPVMSSFFVMFCSGVFTAKAQFVPTTGLTATQLANVLVGQGVTISNATLSCPSGASGKFTALGTSLGIDSGLVLASGQVANGGTSVGIANPASAFASFGGNTPGDADLSALSGVTTNDACKLEFDFIPVGDTVKFQYRFGSEEYPEYSCSQFGDVFGFFITGPGIAGQVNLARVPGTTIPVTINSINPGPGSNGNASSCTPPGSGAPYSAYYVPNDTSSTIVYDGLTTTLTAQYAVTPCTTYHLKLAIADGTDASFDSGVFLKAGSLTSEALVLTPIGGGGLTIPAPYTVRGCLPGQIKFRRPTVRNTPLTVFYQIAGTAVNGVDYTLIPDSVVIPANDSVAFVNIQGLSLGTTQPTRNVKLRIYAPGCGLNTGLVVDSTILEIRDSFQAAVLTPDTIICRGQSVNIRVDADPALSFSWSPATGLSASNVRQPVATPLTTTTYFATVSLPGSGCASVKRRLLIVVRQPPIVNAGRDTTTCVGAPYTFPTTVTTAVPVNQTYSYSWTPTTGISNPAIQNPTVTPATAGTTTQYIITVSAGVPGCATSDTVNVRALPNTITLFNGDTAFCLGGSVQIKLNGDPNFTYQWLPITSVSDPASRQPVIQPAAVSTTNYSVTASFPGCPPIVRNLRVDVQPNPSVNIGPDRAKCQWDTLQLNPSVEPASYPAYIYSWTPATAVQNPAAKNTLFINQANTTLSLTVRTPAGCTGTDQANYTVYQGNFAAIGGPADTGICPRTVISYRATGGRRYQWSPAVFLSSDTGANVTANPITDVTYTVLVTDTNGCFDTLYSALNVFPSSTFMLPDSVVLYPGDSVQFQPGGNGSYYSWFPTQGLSGSNISNPVAQPTVNTRYFLTATTESGCVLTDSVDVIVREESVLALPNAFAPGSGPNGVFKISRAGIASLRHFRIFNRWGTKVFETNNLESGWDGTYNGEPQPMGVYIYDVEAQTNTGRRFTQQGNVTLIR